MENKEYTKKYGLNRWYKITDVAELLNDLNSLHDFHPISVEENTGAVYIPYGNECYTHPEGGYTVLRFFGDSLEGQPTVELKFTGVEQKQLKIFAVYSYIFCAEVSEITREGKTKLLLTLDGGSISPKKPEREEEIIASDETSYIIADSVSVRFWETEDFFGAEIGEEKLGEITDEADRKEQERREKNGLWK